MNSAFNVTGTGGIGIPPPTVAGLNTVNLTGGTVSAAGNGIDATATGEGSIAINLNGGSIGTSTAAPLAGRVGGFGVLATQSGAALPAASASPAPARRSSRPMTASLPSISVAGATGGILITQNGAITAVGTGAAGQGDGISAAITDAALNRNIAINANANIIANTGLDTDGVRSNNQG